MDKDEFSRKLDAKYRRILPEELRTHIVALAEQVYSNHISALQDPANESFYQGEIADAARVFLTRVLKG